MACSLGSTDTIALQAYAFLQKTDGGNETIAVRAVEHNLYPAGCAARGLTGCAGLRVTLDHLSMLRQLLGCSGCCYAMQVVQWDEIELPTVDQ